MYAYMKVEWDNVRACLKSLSLSAKETDAPSRQVGQLRVTLSCCKDTQVKATPCMQT
jgi:hypothetical protein